jgi:hypothetical protein
LVTEPFARGQSASATDEQVLRGIEVETARFESHNDPAIAKYFADDWVCVGQRRTLSKKEFVENVKQNLATHENGVNPYTVEKKNL